MKVRTRHIHVQKHIKKIVMLHFLGFHAYLGTMSVLVLTRKGLKVKRASCALYQKDQGGGLEFLRA